MTDKDYQVSGYTLSSVVVEIAGIAREYFAEGFRYPAGRSWRIEIVTGLKSAKHLGDS